MQYILLDVHFITLFFEFLFIRFFIYLFIEVLFWNQKLSNNMYYI